MGSLASRRVPPSTLAHGLVERAGRHPDRPAVCFGTGERPWSRVSYAELWRRSSVFAEAVRGARRPGADPQFVLIALPSGIDYVAAFYGCLIAGGVAVPFYPPALSTSRASQAFHRRIVQIGGDCHPSLAILPAGLAEQVRAALPADTRVVSPEELTDPSDVDAAGQLRARPEDLALLQYTSGSTSAPRGVMVSHANLVHNTTWLGARLGSADGEAVTTWLPLFHDMGLIGMVCHPLAAGMTVYLTTPAAFVRRPSLWLRTISESRSAVTMAPNFAYDLAVRSVTEEQKSGLDLSCLRYALNAAEPVRPATLESFTQAYRAYGLNPAAIAPGYGLAENTLCASVSDATAPRPRLAVSTARLNGEGVAVPARPGEARTVLVGCGSDFAPDHETVIVDPQSCRPCPAGTVGEIWCTGPSVAHGYWGQVEASEHTFAAQLSGDGRRFLRTGDLGTTVDGELYIVGRLKDVIIQHGVNHYPQDVEYTAQAAHPAIQPGAAAVFTVDDTRPAVLVCELTGYGRKLQPDTILGAVRSAVAAEHGMELSAVALVRRGQIPKTTSGKVRRRASAQRWLAGGFDTVAIWSPSSVDVPDGKGADTLAQPPAEANAALHMVQAVLTEIMLDVPIVPADAFGPQWELLEFGPSSLQILQIHARLQDAFGVEFPRDVLFEHATIGELAGYFASIK
jgi:acyl-CoA synthetase (AMP-forming)/AMP-acid ligase II